MQRHSKVNIYKKRGLTCDEKINVTSLLASGLSTLEVAKELLRGHRSIIYQGLKVTRHEKYEIGNNVLIR